jgi:hypothetical protein
MWSKLQTIEWWLCRKFKAMTSTYLNKHSCFKFLCTKWTVKEHSERYIRVVTLKFRPKECHCSLHYYHTYASHIQAIGLV